MQKPTISAVSPSAQNVYADICCSILVALLQYLYRYLQQSDTFIYVLAHTAYAVFCAHTHGAIDEKRTQKHTERHTLFQFGLFRFCVFTLVN